MNLIPLKLQITIRNSIICIGICILVTIRMWRDLDLDCSVYAIKIEIGEKIEFNCYSLLSRNFIASFMMWMPI